MGPTAEGSARIGSVKTNIGHTDAAAGVAGFIKTVLALRHREVPPSLHFTAPNPQLELAASPFVVPVSRTPWEVTGAPRRAGVSSLGIGGTNAHAVLEEAPALPPTDPGRPYQLLVQSARTRSALDAASGRLSTYLNRNPSLALADAAWTLQTGRRSSGTGGSWSPSRHRRQPRGWPRRSPRARPERWPGSSAPRWCSSSPARAASTWGWRESCTGTSRHSPRPSTSAPSWPGPRSGSTCGACCTQRAIPSTRPSA